MTAAMISSAGTESTTLFEPTLQIFEHFGFYWSHALFQQCGLSEPRPQSIIPTNFQHTTSCGRHPLDKKVLYVYYDQIDK